MLSSSHTPLWPTILVGHRVCLAPMTAAHCADLQAIAQACPEIFTWFFQDLTQAVLLQQFVADAIAAADQGLAYPYVVITRHDGRIVGTTRIGALEPGLKAEIGWTWLEPKVQRTPVNAECKYLLMRMGFEQMGLQRIEFKTDSLNLPSRAALARIGAQQEGTLRNHMRLANGRLRHSVYFSVTAQEWPRVSAGLQKMRDQSFSFV